MAPDYYNGYGGGPSGKRRRSLVMRLVDLALTLVTLAVGATMVLTYFVPYVDPGSVWFFPVLGLAAPAVYVASVVLTLLDHPLALGVRRGDAGRRRGGAFQGLALLAS